MKVRWSEAAIQDRREIANFIALDNLLAAIRMDELFSAAAASLSEQPLLGRSGKIVGTLELSRMKTIGWCTKSLARRCGFWHWCMSPVYGRL